MAFTGKATYSAFAAELAVDVSPLISLRAPIVTPVLDLIGDATNPITAQSTEHTWRDDEYAPAFTVIASVGVNSATAATYIQVNGEAGHMQVGDVWQLGTVNLSTGREHVQIDSIVGGGGSSSANTIHVTRGAFGTSQTSITAGTSLIFIANASLEGESQRPDISRVRVAIKNYVQPIVKPVEVALSMEAVEKYNQIGSEFEFQARRRIDEGLRDLENAVLRGTSTETIGNGTTYRTMKGLWNWITNTHTITTAAFNTDFIDDAIESGWLLGHYQGYNLMIVGGTAQKLLDRLPEVTKITSQDERYITRVVRTYESGLTGGPMRIVVTPNMDPRAFIITHTECLAVVPLQERSFQFFKYALTGQSQKGELVGEYTVEVRQPVTMIRGYITV